MATLSRPLRVCVRLMLSLSLALPRAHAEAPLAPGSSADEQARELYLRGERAYQEGDYEKAIHALRLAYELSQRPALLYDTANALERLGRYAEAAAELERYAADAPEQQREIVGRRILSLKARAAEGRYPESPFLPSVTPLPQAPATERPNTRAAPAEQGTVRPLVGYIVAGTGLACIGVGVALAVSARSVHREARDLCRPAVAGVVCPDRTRTLLDQAGNDALAANITWAVGAAAMAGGLFLTPATGVHDAPASTLGITPLARGMAINLVHAF